MTGLKGWAGAASACLVLAGCAAGTGVVPIGPDTYAVSEMRAPVRGGGWEAQRVVLATAAGFCRQRSQGVDLLSLVPGGDPRGLYWPTAFDATFRCRPEGQSPAPAAPVPRQDGG